MIVKKYKGANETEAILAAKNDLGPGAVVLNVKTMRRRGLARLFSKDFVEITAALESEDNKTVETKATPKKPETPQQPASKLDMRVEDSTPMKRPQDFAQADEKANAIEKKLDNLHDLLANQMGKEENTSKSEPKATEPAESSKDNTNFKSLKLMYKKMIDNETDEKYANQIINDIESSLKKESNLDSILASVYQKIILKLGEPKTIELGTKQKVIFFIGPTGVGKTTTIAKLASDLKLNREKKIALMTADTYRIAAVEQLNTYASILDVPVDVVYTPEEMAEHVAGLKDYDVVMIDTAGRSHKNEEQRLEVLEMVKNIRESELDVDVEVYLVLSVTTKYRDLLSIVDAYQEISDYRLLFTKLDETATFGNILNIRAYTNAPLSYTTSGQNVPDDIETIDVQKLARKLLGGE